MKSAKVKRSRKNNDYFSLENLDSRVGTAHAKVSKYRQKGIRVSCTMTILNEFNHNTIRKAVDSKCYSLNYAMKDFIIRNVLKKRDEIISKLSPCFDVKFENIKDLHRDAESFYSDPDKKEKLHTLMEKKKISNILPGRHDIIIIAECNFISKSENKSVILLTNDGHFTEFSDEIKNKFNIDIDPI
jgi:hypothetical protein